MSLKTKKPNLASSDDSDRLAALAAYIDELSDEIEFKFEVLTGAVEKLRQIIGSSAEGSDAE